MPSITENQHFENRSTFVGERIRTCAYRFYKILQTRKKEIPRLKQAMGVSNIQDQVRERVLTSVDEYVNCLRLNHRGGQMPEYLVGSVNKFKELAYTRLAPQYILEDLRLQITNQIFNENYKI